MDTFIAIIPLMIIFARLYYVFFEWEYYASDWTADLRHPPRRPGLLRRCDRRRPGDPAGHPDLKKIQVSSLLDFLVVYVPLGQAIGRWGNFFNQEAFGNNTTLPWGMYSNQTGKAYLRSVTGTGLDPAMPVHPTFLYEFIGQHDHLCHSAADAQDQQDAFQVTLWYLLLYGFVRFFVEGIRTDPLMIGGTSIRMSQLLSALMVIGLGHRADHPESAPAEDGSWPQRWLARTVVCARR